MFVSNSNYDYYAMKLYIENEGKQTSQLYA